MSRRLTGIWTATAMAVLILDFRTALIGAQDGIDLCIRTVIPSLFPFFILSILLTGTLAGQALRWLSPVGKLLRIPKGTESLLLTGLVGGYPVGAQCVSQAFENGHLSNRDAQRMLVFCNQCGPAFLFGMIGSVLDGAMCWFLWGIQIFSAIITGLLIPGNGRSRFFQNKENPISVTNAMGRAVRVMGQVCGWIILFRVLFAFLERWALWYVPDLYQILVKCLLEISNGTVALRELDDPSVRFLICAGMLSFGGGCVMMQTYSCISPKLDRRLYFPGKVLQCCICLLLAAIIVKKSIIIPVAAMIGTVSLLKIRKNSSIPETIGV